MISPQASPDGPDDPDARGTLGGAGAPVAGGPEPRRRLLAVLLGTQVLAGFGSSAGVAAVLLAHSLTGSDAAAGLAPALQALGTALVAVPVSELARRRGRRPGLGAALALATAGSVGVVAAGAARSLALLLVAMAAFGAGNSAVLLSRYAAADLSSAADRGRAIGAVVFATTLGAVAGPNLIAPAGRLGAALGLPPLTGLFALGAVAFALAAAVLLVALRPDPRSFAVRDERAAPELVAALRAEPPAARGRHRRALAELFAAPLARAGLATIVGANVVMVAVMGMAPLQMRAVGHGLAFVGIVVSLHTAGMFGPAPVSGWLVDRLGAARVAVAGSALLLAAAVAAALAGGSAAATVAGLTALGVGWNASLVSGSALLAAGVPAAERPRAEAVGDLTMGATAALATAMSGEMVALAGYPALAAVCALAAASLAPAQLVVARSRDNRLRWP